MSPKKIVPCHEMDNLAADRSGESEYLKSKTRSGALWAPVLSLSARWIHVPHCPPQPACCLLNFCFHCRLGHIRGVSGWWSHCVPALAGQAVGSLVTSVPFMSSNPPNGKTVNLAG